MWSWIKSWFVVVPDKCWVIGCEDRQYRGSHYCAAHKATVGYIKSRPVRDDWWRKTGTCRKQR